MEVERAYAGSVELWTGVVSGVPGDGWDRPTPAGDWDLRALVNHVVGEDRWTVPLLEGRTIAEVGDALDGDLLGADPVSAARVAAEAALAAAAAPGATARTVALSYGPEAAAEYLWQLTADHLVHAWDVAVAAAAPTDPPVALPPDLVDAVAEWYADREEAYRGAGLVADRVDLPRGAGAQDRLLAAFGRDPAWNPVLAAVGRFGTTFEAAFGSGDVDAVMALMTEDCAFESTSPAPDGRRVEGAAAVRAEWAALVAGTRDGAWTWEEVVVAGDRATVRWRFSWSGDDGPGHVRGVDVLRLRAGKVAEKLSYVKG